MDRFEDRENKVHLSSSLSGFDSGLSSGLTSEFGSNSMPVPGFGDQSPYQGKVEAIIDADEFLANLQASVEVQGKRIVPGQIPGEKSICGELRGNRFKIRKAGAFANPMTRDLVGVVEERASGSVINYQLEQRPVVTFFQTSALVAIVSIGMFSTMIFLSSLRFMSASSPNLISTAGIVAVGGPLVLLILFLVLFSVLESTGTSDQEELLDHVRKLASGINVSS